MKLFLVFPFVLLVACAPRRTNVQFEQRIDWQQVNEHHKRILLNEYHPDWYQMPGLREGDPAYCSNHREADCPHISAQDRVNSQMKQDRDWLADERPTPWAWTPEQRAKFEEWKRHSDAAKRGVQW